ncbi:hypothetical protein [Nocardia sp. NPDC049149]
MTDFEMHYVQSRPGRPGFSFRRLAETHQDVLRLTDPFPVEVSFAVLDGG